MLKKITKVYWFSNLICKIHINELIIKTREICNNIIFKVLEYIKLKGLVTLKL